MILAAAQCSLGQDNPDYICGGEDDKDGRPVCECKTNVCYFKLNIEHFQVSSDFHIFQVFSFPLNVQFLDFRDVIFCVGKALNIESKLNVSCNGFGILNNPAPFRTRAD